MSILSVTIWCLLAHINKDTNTSIDTITSIKTVTDIITGINKMPSLLLLPNEVLQEVVDLLLDSSTSDTILSLAFVNRALRSTVQYRQHKVLRIPPRLDPEFFEANIDNLFGAYLSSLEARDLLPAVRSIELVLNGPRHYNQYFWDALYRLVPTAKGLQNIHVCIPVSDPTSFSSPLVKLLDILQSRMPLVGVYAKLRSPLSGFPPLQVFRDFRNLYALEYTVYKSRDFRNAPEILPLLKNILRTCPNLRILKLYTRTARARRQMRFLSYQPTYADKERPRCLETLELQDTNNWATADLPPDLWDPNFDQLSGNYDDSWFEKFFDWSKLHHLRIKEVTLLPYLTKKLTGLKSFEAPNASGYDRRDVKKFLLDLPSRLERIKLPIWSFIPLQSLMEYGPTLRVLHFTHSSMMYPGHELTAYKIQLIRAFCPCLEEFGLSVRRQSRWPEGIMDALSSFPKLSSLTIITRFCEVEDSYTSPTREDLTQPYITFSEVRNLYNRLSRKLSGKNTLKRLKVQCYTPEWKSPRWWETTFGCP
ncbi:hypothetical protein F4782DRAFT_509410 [Xylaria castorea]|nr:hypothetical protein F4782DRAFT_509410 [Xylaria castorea]